MKRYPFPICLFLIVFLAAIPPLKSQEYITSLKHYGVAEGLPFRDVNAVFQDSRGFIWLSQSNYVSRFDGYEFKSWTKEQVFIPNDVSVVIRGEDSEGYLWILSIQHEKILAITLLHIETNEILTFTEKFGSSLPFQLSDLRDCFTTTPDHTLYFVDGENRLFSYHHQEGFNSIALPFSRPLEAIAFTSPTTIAGRLSYLRGSRNLVKIDLKNQKYETEPIDEWTNFTKNPPPNSVVKLNYDQQNQHLVEISDNASFFIAHPEDSTRFIFTEIKSKDYMIFDNSQIKIEPYQIWANGVYGAYQLTIRKTNFKRFLYSTPSNSFTKTGVIRCRDIIEYKGEIYVATPTGLANLVNKATRINQFLKEILTKRTTVLLKTQDESIYISTPRYLLKVNSDESVADTASIPTSDYTVTWSMYEDKNGKIWLGNENGLQVLNTERDSIQDFTAYHEFPELEKAFILDIREDREGTIWLSTNYGFYILDLEKGIIARYWSKGAGAFYLPTDNVQHFYQDKDGIFWLATHGDGLIRWDEKKNEYQQFTTSQGLSHNVIYAIYEDDYDNLWLSSDYGIMQFNKKTYAVQSYQVNDGITHEEFNRISHFQATDGTIYFGGLNGVTAFHPKDFQELDTIPDALLQVSSFFQFDGEQNKLIDKTAELVKSQTITMLPNDRFFLLHFALLTYEEVDKIRYAYKIEGIDEDWNEQKENFIRLSRLPYGNYTLKIKGQSARGKWSEHELHIQLRVLKPFYLSWWFLGLSLLGLMAGFFMFYRFLINRKLADQENLKLKEVDALKSRLYTYITHEFRTPLTVILGITEHIKEHVQEKKLIRRNGQNLLRLVDQLLDLSGLDIGGIKIKARQADIISYLQYLIESFHTLAEEKNIRLVFYTEEERILMDFDEYRIQQIIYNLVSNALKFTLERGKIILHAQKTEQAGKPVLMLKIEDSGIGISADALPHIFNRFYQEDGSNTRTGEGTGIGLALTQELVKLMDGTINVTSTVGKGTIFTIQLPITQHAPLVDLERKEIAPLPPETEMTKEEMLPQNSVMDELDQARLLIIEDNRDVALYIKKCVQADYAVHFAFDGEAGINQAYELIPDIIICDIMMPKKDGFEVVQTLKQEERTSHIPIILLTAKASLEDKISGLQYGADAYLTKPFQPKELAVRLENLIVVRKRLQAKYRQADLIKSLAPKTEDVYLQKLQAAILKNIDQPNFGPNELAHELGTSRTQLHRKLKALTDTSTSNYINKIRLAEAKVLLRSENLSIAEIAYAVGYSSPQYFGKIFSKEFGTTPGEFRNDYKN